MRRLALASLLLLAGGLLQASSRMDTLLMPVDVPEQATVLPATPSEEIPTETAPAKPKGPAPLSLPKATQAAPAPVADPTEKQAPKVKLQPVTHTLSHNTLESAIERAIQDRLALEGDLQVSLRKQFRPIMLNSPNWEIAELELPRNGLTSNCTVNFKFAVDGELVEPQYSAPVHCEHFTYALIPKQNYKNGVALSHDFFTREKIDILRTRTPLVPIDTDLTEYELRLAITKGRPLAWEHIDSRPLIHRGDVITLIASEGGMHVTTQGLAMSHGFANDIIKVRNMASKQIIEAQIIDSKTARVHF